MRTVTYITGNASKHANAKAFLEKYNVDVAQQKLFLDEIQAEDAVAIAVRKARDAYAELGTPLFVNDASWLIPALGGFPGPYMRYMVEWFTMDDLLTLMQTKADRTVILRDTIVYIDEQGEKVFTHDTPGKILEAPAGEPRGPFVTQLFSLRADGKSIAEDETVGFSESEAELWNEFGAWLTNK